MRIVDPDRFSFGNCILARTGAIVFNLDGINMLLSDKECLIPLSASEADRSEAENFARHVAACIKQAHERNAPVYQLLQQARHSTLSSTKAAGAPLVPRCTNRFRAVLSRSGRGRSAPKSRKRRVPPFYQN